jgi:hypothetical protein
MTHPRSSILRSALASMSIRLVAMQLGLAVLVFALAVVWLRLPDASAVDLIGTVLLGLLVLALTGGCEAALVLRLCGRPLSRDRLLKGALLVVLAITLWLGWSAVIDHLSANDMMRAGYLNSRFPAHWRNTFSYLHLYRWLEGLWSTLAWLAACVLALFVVALTASAKPLRTALCALGSATFWLVLLLVGVGTPLLTSSLLGWTPGHGLRREAISVLLRLIAAAVADATFAMLLLAVLAACVQRADAVYATPVGTPEDNQPLTDEVP